MKHLLQAALVGILISQASGQSRFATQVVQFNQGGGGGLFDPSLILGGPQGGGLSAGSLDVLSLGTGGDVTLAFEVTITNGPGADLIVFENAFAAGSGAVAGAGVATASGAASTLPGSSAATGISVFSASRVCGSGVRCSGAGRAAAVGRGAAVVRAAGVGAALGAGAGLSTPVGTVTGAGLAGMRANDVHPLRPRFSAPPTHSGPALAPLDSLDSLDSWENPGEAATRN